MTRVTWLGRQEIVEFKGIEDVSENDELGIRIPYEIYRLRKRGSNKEADRVLDHFMHGRYSEALQMAREE